MDARFIAIFVGPYLPDYLQPFSVRFSASLMQAENGKRLRGIGGWLNIRWRQDSCDLTFESRPKSSPQFSGP